MQLHADPELRVVLDTGSLPWLPSPSPGVRRRLLERDGEEVARATTIVRYGAGCRFPAHRHGGGEEILVLAGIFSDEHGHYPAGTYLRNPVGSSHAPYSRGGCTLLVKLHQMHPLDRDRVVRDTTTGGWRAAGENGVAELPLHSFGSEQVALIRWAPGTELALHSHPGGEEILVLAGILEDEEGRYPRGTWLRNPSGSRHAPWSADGCTFLMKTGHLPATVEPAL